MSDRITKIKKGTDTATPIAVEADNVFITYTVFENGENVSKKCSLQQFFNEWETFKEEAHFIRESSNISAGNENIKLWFETPTVSQP